MKCLFLAAGYATRLYPLTENFPKPLLKVQNKSILDWLIEDINKIKDVDEYIVVSNHKFVNFFCEWAKSHQEKITVIDDGTTSNEDRLGAVKDIELAISQLSINDDLFVLAGDNLVDFSFSLFIDYFKQKGTSSIFRYFEKNTASLTKRGVLSFDNDDLVTEMVEKPDNPKTNWCCPPFYLINRHDLCLVNKSIIEGINPDAPGSFISYLCAHSKVHAMEMPGHRYDIGDLKSYQEIEKTYQKKYQKM